MLEKQHKYKIVIIDEDQAISNLLLRFLTNLNYQVVKYSNSQEAYYNLNNFQPDLAILDIGLSDGNGAQLCRDLVSTGTLVIVLSRIDHKLTILKTYAEGIDDYITKPFDMEILQAKITAVLKRKFTAPKYQNLPEKSMTFNQLVIDAEKCQVVHKHKLVNLTPREFDLLVFLARNPGKMWPREELIKKIWNTNNNGKVNYARKIDVHIGQIRKKLGDTNNKLIKTVRGKGYMFSPPPPKFSSAR